MGTVTVDYSLGANSIFAVHSTLAPKSILVVKSPLVVGSTLIVDSTVVVDYSCCRYTLAVESTRASLPASL